MPLQAFKDLDVSPDSMGLTRKIQLQKNELIRQLDAAISLSWDSEQGVVSDDQIAVVLSSDPQHPLLQIEWLRYLKLSPAAMTQTVLLKVDSAWLGDDFLFNIQQGRVAPRNHPLRLSLNRT